MLERFYLKYRDNPENVGIISVDCETDSYNFTENSGYSGSIPAFLRFKHEVNYPISDGLKVWIADRVPEPGYAFIDALIEKAGLKQYDAYGFFKYNKGKFMNDGFYIEEIK